MNINQTLLKEIKPYLACYDCDERQVEAILSRPGTFERWLHPFVRRDRQEQVVNTISSIMEPHGKRHLFEHILQLRRVENGVHSLVPLHRDHVLHTLRCYLLGIYINEKFIPTLQRENVESFQWEIASLFHDIGYPIEIAFKAICGPYFDALNESFIGRHPLPDGICDLTRGRNSLEIIQLQLEKWHLNIDVRAEYKKMIRPLSVNHGMISSITLLKTIDTLYQQKNPNGEYSETLSLDRVDWNQKYFEEDIVPACAAIFVHGLSRRCFAESKVKLSFAPLVVLLKLSDCLQEWDRSFNKKQNFASTRFDIEVNNNRLILTARIPDGRKDQIRSEINDCIEDSQVEIR